MNEQQIQGRLIKKLESRGYYVVKVIAGSRAGVPDLLVCKPPEGRFIGIECKTKSGKLSELQIYNGEKIKKAGGIFIIHRGEKAHDQLSSNSPE
jgi:Holliday junction resolvase